MINPVAIRHAFEVLRMRHVNTDALFQDMGMMANDFEAHDLRLSFRQACTLVDRALRLLPDPFLGHQVGLKRNVVSTGLLGLALATCPSVSDVVTLLVRYWQQLGVLPTLSEAPGEHGSRYLIADAVMMDAHVRIFAVCEAFTAIVQLIRALTGPHFKPQAVAMVRPRPNGEAVVHQFYQVPVQFSQVQNHLLIGAEWLDVRLKTADAVVFKQMITLLDAEKQAQRPPDLVQTIERLIRSRLMAPATLPEVAEALGTSVRTLRRNLVDAGTSYHDISINVYRTQAVALLRQQDMAVADVAVALGFADARTFRRAFKRWTGLSPSDVRKKLA